MSQREGEGYSRVSYPLLYKTLVSFIFMFISCSCKGCIPVLLHNPQHVLPFSEVLDWDRGVVMMWKEELSHLLQILKGYSRRVRKEKRVQVMGVAW